MNRTHAILSFVLILCSGCGKAFDDGVTTGLSAMNVDGVTLSETNLVEILKLSPLPKLSPNPTNQYADNKDAALLGQALFFDTGLSINGKIACATCHQPDNDWTDGKPLSKGLQSVTRNAPTLWNVGYQRWHYWDGRKDTLWSQALNPIEHPHEMGGSRLRVYRQVNQTEVYRNLYQSVFGEFPPLSSEIEFQDARPIPERPEETMHQAWQSLSVKDQGVINRVFSNIGKSMEAYQRRLISTDSLFDQFVHGLRSGNDEDLQALSPAAIRGLVLFVGRGQCILCHSGPHFTDNEFHNIGLDRGGNPLDQGRYPAIEKLKLDPFNGKGLFSDDTSLQANRSLHYVTKKDNNLGEFKTPTLRNVARTGPYMHDGRFVNLREVIDFYSTLADTPAIGHREESLQALNLTSSEAGDLIAFLNALDGSPLDAGLLNRPTLAPEQ
mgnify:CR=1 FL=1